MTHNELKKVYNDNKAHTAYVYGWKNPVTDMIEACFTHEMVCRETVSSKGHGLSLRFRASAKWAKGQNTFEVGTVKEWNDLRMAWLAKGGNGGHAFEQMVANYYGIEYSKDDAPFWVKGDLQINGEETQVKFNDGTFITEETAMRLVG